MPDFVSSVQISINGEEVPIRDEGAVRRSELFDLVYPVGAIYMSVSSVDPSTLFGGTWVPWGSGRVPVGVNTNDTAFESVEETGGSADAIVPYHNHNFSGNALPTHNHTQNAHSHGGPTISGIKRSYVVVDENSEIQNKYAAISGTDWYAPYLYTDGYGFKQVRNTPTAIATNIAASAGTPSGTISHAGSNGNAENANLQPYITCYMWKRTA